MKPAGDSQDSQGSQSPAPRSPASAGAIAVVVLALVLPVGWLIASGNNIGRAAYDATAYHIRFIRELARDFPAFDISNPLTATTPGYHMLVASIAQIVGDSTTALRSTSALIGAAFVAALAAWCSRRTGAKGAVLLALPLAASIYVVGAAAWNTPDNLAWLLVAGICFLCVRAPLGARDLAAACLLLVLLVSVRQIHIWCAAVIWMSAWADARARGLGAVASLRSALPWMAATVPAILCLAWFVWRWGGLTPPRFQSDVQGFSLATPAFILLQVAVIAVGLAPWLAGPMASAWRVHRARLIAAAMAGVLLAVLPATTASFEAGRFGGWWGVIARFPVLGGHTSVAVLLAAPLGAAAVAALLLGMPLRHRLVLGAALFAFTAALTANAYCWQRYHEPLLLVLLPMLAVLQSDPGGEPRGLRWIPPIALALLLGAITAAGVLRGERVPDDALPAPIHIAPTDRFDAR